MKKRKLAGIIIIAFVILLSMTLVYSSAYLTDMDKKDSIVLKSAKLKNEIAVNLLQNHIDSTASTATMAFTLTNGGNVAIKNSIEITADFDMSNTGSTYNDKITAVYFYPGNMSDAAIVTDIGNGGTAAYARTQLNSEKIKVNLPDIMVDKESSKIVNVKVALKGSDLSGYGNVLSLEITATAGTQNSGDGYGFTEDLGSNNLILYDNINTVDTNNVIVNGIQTIKEVKLSGTYGDVSSASAPFANLYSILPIRDADKVSITDDTNTFRKYGLTLSNGKLYGTLSAVSDGTSSDTVSFSYKSNNKTAGTAHIKIKIDKADSSITTAPTANSLTYSGSAQTLTTSGSCSGGTLYYRLYSYKSNTASTATTYNNSYSTTRPTGTAAGTYVVQYYVVGDSNHNDTSMSSVTVTIARADFTSTVSITGYTYGGTKSTPSVSNNPENGTVTYYGRSTSTGAATAWSSVTSTTYNVGTRYIYAVIAETNNYSSYTTANTSFTISKAASSVTTAPTANTLTYTGSAQTLTTSGSCSGGTLYYRLYSYQSNTASTATTYNNSYSTTRPTGTDAGTYVVQYYVAGDGNHNDTSVFTVMVTIAKASLTATVSISGYTYGGTKSTPSLNNNPSGGTVTYYGRSTSSGTATNWSSVTSTMYNAGTRYIYAVIAATNNYNSYTTANTSFTISKADFTATVSISGYTYGGTKSTPSVSNNPGNGNVTYYGRSTSSGTATNWANVTSTTYNAGTRYIYAVIGETTNYNSYTTSNTSFTISKAASSVTAAPAANTLTYSGSAQTLVTAGSCSGGTLYYRLYSYKSPSASSATIYSNSYSSTRPTGTAAGTYVVQYYAVGDTNHNDTSTSTVSVTISKASQTAPTSLTYSIDSSLNVTLTASGSGNTSLEYRISTSSTWQSNNVFSGLSKDTTYTFYARYALSDNYDASSTKSVSVSTSYFTWSGTTITGVTALGKTQKVLEVPSKTTAINSTAFSNCTELVMVYVDKDTDTISGKPWGMPNADSKYPSRNVLWYDDYIWENNGTTINGVNIKYNNVSSDESYQRIKNTSIVYIPSRCRMVKNINGNGYLWEAETVIVAEGVTQIGYSDSSKVFYSTQYKYTTIYFPSTIETIKANTFYWRHSGIYLNVYINKPSGSMSVPINHWGYGDYAKTNIIVHFNDAVTANATLSSIQKKTLISDFSGDFAADTTLDIDTVSIPISETIEVPEIINQIGDTQTENAKSTPTAAPTAVPTITPSASPSITDEPDASPIVENTIAPTESAMPIASPTPTASDTPKPKITPTPEATHIPEETETPTAIPTAMPTVTPFASPSTMPTSEPEFTPTTEPASMPEASIMPSDSPAPVAVIIREEVWDNSLFAKNTALTRFLNGYKGVLSM